MKTPPEDRIPSDQELLQLLQSTGGQTLRQLCQRVWPDLRWGDAMADARLWITDGRRYTGTSAMYLLRRMVSLRLQGKVDGQHQETEEIGEAVRYVLPAPPPVVVEMDL